MKRLAGLVCPLLQIALSVGLFWAGFGAIAPSAKADSCRTYYDRELCIVSIKRSAKYYWEYRAEVKIDGKRRPLQKYDCRRRIRIRRDGSTVPFEKHGAGDYICKLLN